MNIVGVDVVVVVGMIIIKVIYGVGLCNFGIFLVKECNFVVEDNVEFDFVVILMIIDVVMLFGVGMVDIFVILYLNFIIFVD